MFKQSNHLIFAVFRGAILVAILGYSSFAQDLKAKYNWHNLDFEKDGVRGISTEKTYDSLLKNRPSQTVIVGVIDSGVDINHEDLKGSIWENVNETIGNGLDDDHNGFVDDVNGWDFIGASNGKDINQEQYESVRIYKKLLAKFGDKPSSRFIKKNKSDYDLFKEVKSQIDKDKKEAEKLLPMYSGMLENYEIAENLLAEALKKPNFSKDEVMALDEQNFDIKVRKAKRYYLSMIMMGASEADLQEGVDHFKDELNYKLNPDFEPRKIINDDLSKLEFGKYGNTDIIGPDCMHGTHVSGIIGANRKNNIGVMGVADNVKILPVRCVPNGDERDKDVANAIRYAVDNGAQIINMSFGKPYSPEKKWVDEAVKYAEDKNVLIVSAAGNESENLDLKPHFPTRNLDNGKKIKNWIVVGAQNFEETEKIVADFSNYGKTAVDVFAPGTAIYSTVPGSKYEEKQGTSMASPVVAGLAALLKSYFPELTAAQLKDIIVNSSVKFKDKEVILPGSTKTCLFGDLCVSAGFANAWNAVKMAIEITSKKL